MQGKQLRKLEAELWRAADQLRANSKLTATEYSMPVLGLIFLRHAFNRFEKVKVDIEKNLPFHPKRGRRAIDKKDFLARNALFLPEKARFDFLVALPESADIGEAIDDAMKAIEEEYDNLKGVLPRNYSIFSKDLLRELLRIFNKEVLQKAEGDLFGKIYEYFLNKFPMTGAQEGGEFFTPMSLVQTIVNVIEPDHGVVFDPACGSADMFVQTGYFIESEGLRPAEKVTFYGQEKAEVNTKLAKMNLAVHGLEGNLQEGNTFYEDKHSLVGKCNFVMANPPFNVDGVDKTKDAVKKDPRLMLDGKVHLPKNDNANYLWIQYFYNYLKPTGRSGFVMASSASDAGHSEKLIREKLVKTGAVDVMMAVGNNFFYTRSLPCTLWFFDRTKEQDELKRDKVLMLDARKIYRKVTSKINDFSPEQLQNLICIVNLYRGNTQKFEDTVQHYLEKGSDFAKETATTTAELQKQLQKVLSMVSEYFQNPLLFSTVSASNGANGQDAPAVSIDKLLEEIEIEASEVYRLQNELIANVAQLDHAENPILLQIVTQTKGLRKPQEIIDLSGLNFEILEQLFLKAKNKNAVVQSLKEKVEKRLKQMVDKNPLRVDFYQRYQEIIDEYNRGKDAVTIEETFKKLIEFINSLTEEEVDTKRKGLTDEQKAVFDLLRKPDLSESDKKKIKAIAIELLEELKKDKLKVEQWADKSVTAAAVFNAVSKTLFESLPYPAYQNDDIDLKTNLVYEHLKQQYFGGGVSIYGSY